MACSGLFNSWATPDTSTPIAARRSCRITCFCSDCTSSLMRRSSSTCAAIDWRALFRLVIISPTVCCR